MYYLCCIFLSIDGCSCLKQWHTTLDKMTVIKYFFKTKIIEIQAAIYSNNNNNNHNDSFLDFFLAVIFIYAASAFAYDLVLSSS